MHINPYIPLLKKDSILAVVECLTSFALTTNNSEVAFHRRKLAGSLIGGIAETQEVLDFCGKHNIVSEVELIPIDRINNAFRRMVENDVRYRFVLDVAGSLNRDPTMHIAPPAIIGEGP